jgi:hypothetical protein
MKFMAKQDLHSATNSSIVTAEQRRDRPQSPICFIEMEAERDNDAAVRWLVARLAFAAVFMAAGYALAKLT